MSEPVNPEAMRAMAVPNVQHRIDGWNAGLTEIERDGYASGRVGGTPLKERLEDAERLVRASGKRIVDADCLVLKRVVAGTLGAADIDRRYLFDHGAKHGGVQWRSWPPHDDYRPDGDDVVLIEVTPEAGRQ